MPNPGLSRTRPYPFARLRKLFEGIVPAEGKLKPISLGIAVSGGPHATLRFRSALAKRLLRTFRS